MGTYYERNEGKWKLQKEKRNKRKTKFSSFRNKTENNANVHNIIH